MENNINSMNRTQANIEARSQIQGYNSTKKSSGSDLSVDDFLKILAAELSNPSIDGAGGGGGKTDYISQLAQLTTLEYIGELNDNMMFLNLQEEQRFGTSLIGQEVKVMDNHGDYIIGVVDKVKFKNGFTMIEINGEEYYVGNVVETGNDLTIEEPESPEEPEDIEDGDTVNYSSKNSSAEADFDTKPMKRNEITEEYLSEEFLKEKEYFDKNFKDLIG